MPGFRTVAPVDVSVPRDLGRVSLLLVILGLSVLYVANAMYTPPRVGLGEIDGRRMGETIRVVAVVQDIEKREDATFLTLHAENTRIRAVAFRPLGPISAGEQYEVTGRIDVYRGRPEIIVHAASRAE